MHWAFRKKRISNYDLQMIRMLLVYQFTGNLQQRNPLVFNLSVSLGNHNAQ
ncbi:hypothetical protein XBFM1_2320028 [Xenorhabdus bovienii str. feltiae Moldova]|uniref:Transposase n=2 Tax=Xenorhabdus bovienii TaxID=40576 RepID=A0A077PU11_XENBV|nr:hypothetical protein XBFM1_2320028 [Xenorhabdus bovienii str. feltiae Moldova]CDH23339.1 hypothetical protein XBKB1_1710013 [Xenorhabdus bovienii str. kraussei Becker Underwood]